MHRRRPPTKAIIRLIPAAQASGPFGEDVGPQPTGAAPCETKEVFPESKGHLPQPVTGDLKMSSLPPQGRWPQRAEERACLVPKATKSRPPSACDQTLPRRLGSRVSPYFPSHLSKHPPPALPPHWNAFTTKHRPVEVLTSFPGEGFFLLYSCWKEEHEGLESWEEDKA